MTVDGGEMELRADNDMGIDEDISTVSAAIPSTTTDSATDGGVRAKATYTFSNASNTAIFEISADDYSFATGGQAIVASDFNKVIGFTTSRSVSYADAHLPCPQNPLHAP